jgi:hypothetical protein
MRSRASRRRLSDKDIRCSASDRRWFPARPAQHVHKRRNNGKGRIPSALASAHGRNGKRRVETCNAGRAGAHRPSEALHLTRSSDVLPRIARERVPTIAKRRRGAHRRITREFVAERVPTIASRDPTRRRAGSHPGSSQSTQSSVPIQDLCVYPEPDQKSFRYA